MPANRPISTGRDNALCCPHCDKPSLKRKDIIIRLQCEDGCPPADLVISHRNGKTIIQWADGPEQPPTQPNHPTPR